MHEFNIIKDLVVILLVSIPIILLFNKIKLPSIAGFLIAGVVIGPYGFGLITNSEEIKIMAEIGVILLLFTIGLEVSLKEISKIKKLLLIGGGLQLIITAGFTYIVLILLGLDSTTALFCGMLVSLSSTAIVLKLLADEKQLESPHGKISLAILIFQDLAIVPLFLITNSIGKEGTIDILSILSQIGIALVTVTVIIVLAKFIMPKLLYYIARTKLREVFTIGVILLLLGTAYLTFSLGLSFALGAFIAGLILSESEYSSQVIAEVMPLKDTFNSIFFVSVGLLLNLSYVFNHLTEVAVLSILIFIVKAVVIVFVVILLKYPLRTGLLVGFGLAQIGEFSFILAQEGLKYNLLGNLYDLFLSSSIITMLLTPVIFRISTTVYNSKTGSAGELDDPEEESKLNNHVIIAGFGLNGRNVAHVLRETGISYNVIEMNPDTVRIEKEKGEEIIFGDISRNEVLHKAGIEKAKVLVIAISDQSISRRSVKIAKQMNGKLFVVVRTRFVQEVDELSKIGADVVIPEEFETSIQIFKKVLEQYHIPINVIMQQINLLRGESYRWLRDEKESKEIFSHLDEIIAAGLTETCYLTEDYIVVGKSLKEIDLRAKTDATVLAIVRDSKSITNPSSSEILKKGDTVVLTGTHKAVDEAVRLLSESNSNQV